MPVLSIFRSNRFQDFGLYLPIFLLLLVIGIVGGRSAGMIFQFDAPDNARLVSPQERGNGQRNLIIIFVDQMAAPQPELEGIWLLITYPENPDLTLVPIFPDPNQQAASSKSYAETFEMTANNQPGSSFLDLLTENVLWDNYLITDRDGVISILEDASADGSKAFVSVEAAFPDETALTLEQQTMLWQSVCTYLSEIEGQDEFEILLPKLSSNIFTNLNWDQLPLYPWGVEHEEARLECEFPTLNFTAP
jgi:hypothetical protein